MSALQVISRKLFGLIILLLATGPVSVTAAAQTYFYNQSSLPAGTQPTSVVLADFNADGKLDVAVTNEKDNTVSIMLSKPDGSFAPKVDYAVGTAPLAVVSGDFNGDKIPDLAVINSMDNTVSVLLGTTNGTFQSQVTYATGNTPVAILTVDLNGDQKIDLAVANQGDGTVSTLIGNGDGTFQALTATATVSAPLALGSGDFNGDGKPDLVAVNGQGNLSLLLNNQDGGFTASTQSIGFTGSGLTVGDFNGDGNSDIAVGDPDASSLVILVGNGQGGFTTLHQDLAGPPFAISSGDINGDGKADLAVTIGGSTYPSSIAILLSNGDGTFRPALYDGFPGLAPPVAMGDMNNDGYLDLVLPDTIDNVVTIELGNGSGLFTSRADSSLPASGGVLTGAVGDLNGDGKPDVVLVQINQDSQGVTGFLSVLAGNGDGTFKTAVESQIPNIGDGDLVLGDFNGDGKVDAASASISATGGIAVVLGNGDGTFGPSIANPVNIPGLNTQSMIGGDFNHDGKTDLAILSLAQGNSVSYVLLSNGDGTFQPNLVDAVSGINDLAAGDFNHDGNLDIAATSGSGIATSVLVYLGHGDGTFASASSMSTGTASAIGLKAADFNGDGKIDLIVGTGQGFAFFAGNGDGTFQSPVITPTLNEVPTFQLGDFNGDGKLDLAVLGLAPTVAISIGNGDGTFQALLPFQPPNYPRTFTVGDFNADGSTDLMMASTANTTSPNPSQVASVWLSTPTISLPASPILFGPQVVGTSSAPATIALTDVGNAPLSLSAVATSGDFSATDSCPASLPIGQACSLDVAFTPSASGPDKGSLRLSNNGAPGTQVRSLIGTGLTPPPPPPPAAALSSSSLTFSPQPTGSTSSAQLVTLTNSGQVLLNITSIAVSGDFGQTNTCGSSLAAGANCAIAVTFAPTAAGNRPGSLTINDNAGSSPQSVALVGTGSSIAISATSAALTISSPGGSVTDTVQVSSVQGFIGTVTFTCTVTYKGSGAPTDAPACNINPQQAQISASSPLAVVLAVSTTKAAEIRSRWQHTGGAFAALFLMALVPVRRRKYAVPLVVCGIALGLAVAGCGGRGSGAPSTTPSDPGTTAGSYQVVITAASSTVAVSTTISLALE